MSLGQNVDLETDEIFSAAIKRIAPVFQESSRQARIEIAVPNTDVRLKPGMFVRAKVEVRKLDKVSIVPDEAIVTRSDTQGIFMLGADGGTALWRPVQVGIREAARVQIIGDNLSGRVIVLGQQLVEDGSPVTVASDTLE